MHHNILEILIVKFLLLRFILSFTRIRLIINYWLLLLNLLWIYILQR